jgi:hypothetical protein
LTGANRSINFCASVHGCRARHPYVEGIR